MGRGPLQPEADRAAHRYVAALLPTSERADALHDVLADARYWGEEDLLPVLRIAHAVVSQRQRVTDEVAVQVLGEELALPDTSVAAVLGMPVEAVVALRRRVREPVARFGGSGDTPEPASVRNAAPAVPVGSSPPEPAVRIGFDEEPMPTFHEPAPDLSGRRLVAVALIALVAALAVWLVLR
jgi:hypothetical protein